MRVRILHHQNGGYTVVDEKNNVVQAGWIAQRVPTQQRDIAVAANLRDASQVALEAPAIQRLHDLFNLGKAKQQVTSRPVS